MWSVMRSRRPSGWTYHESKEYQNFTSRSTPVYHVCKATSVAWQPAPHVIGCWRVNASSRGCCKSTTKVSWSRRKAVQHGQERSGKHSSSTRERYAEMVFHPKHMESCNGYTGVR